MSPEPTQAPHHGAETGAKLVRMANQIAIFFRSQPEETGAEGVAAHINRFWINRFWAPRRRNALLATAEAGTAGFDPMVVKAMPLVRRRSAATQDLGAPGAGTAAAKHPPTPEHG